MEGELINEQETLDGELGYKGERGYSSYEIAVLNGFEGTEQDWLDHFGVDLTGYINTNDVIDNLTSTSTNYPLSANQGKELKTLVDSKANSSTTYNKTEIDNKIDNINNTLSNKINNDRFAIVETSNKTWSSQETAKLSYPNGFTSTNCCIVSITAVMWSDNYSSFVSSYSMPYIISDSSINHFCSAYLLQNEIWLISSSTSSTKYKYRLLLMKVDSE